MVIIRDMNNVRVMVRFIVRSIIRFIVWVMVRFMCSGMICGYV